MAKHKNESRPSDVSAKENKPQETLNAHKAATKTTERDKMNDHNTPNTRDRTTNHDRNSSPKWSGGSWRGKATAVAEVARESVSGAVQPKNSPRTPSKGLPRKLTQPNKSRPSITSISRVNVTSNNVDDDLRKGQDIERSQSPAGREVDMKIVEDKDTPKELPDDAQSIPRDRPVPASGWRGWWTKPKAEGSDSEKNIENPITSSQEACAKPNEDQKKDTQSDSKSGVQEDISKDASKADKTDSNDKGNDEYVSTDKPSATNRSSWFGLWGSGQAAIPTTESTPSAPKAESVEPAHSDVKAISEPASADKQRSLEDTEHLSQRPASGSWAFWTWDKSKSIQTSAIGDEPKTEIGELAIARSPSQSDPQPVQLNETTPSPVVKSDIKSKKRERPVSSEETTQKKKSTVQEKPVSDAPAAEVDSKDLSHMQESVLKTTVSKPKKSNQKSPPNLLLPSFRSTYPVHHNPSYWQQISRMFNRDNPNPHNHLYLSESPHKVKKAIAIGIHGYFPAPLLQKVLGQPTGTSFRFANGAAAAIQKWAANRNLSVEVEKVALEGEGLIADRVDTLWKLLLNWIDSIRKADCIIVACHSQGVPVAISLVARLLNFGCLNPSARVGICGMAGVNLGPFSHYQSRFYGASASELFDFSKPSSSVSQAYASALFLVLSHNVRITYVGSIDDQLVSLESSIFSNASHPYIYRAVFVDGRIHAPDFLTHLVGFALKVRNLGLSDHQLIRELSAPLAGSLYTGEGHSRIYEDVAVYDLAVQHALETANLPDGTNPPLEIKPYEAPGSQAANPYFLPWAMRGLLEEEAVRRELKGEMDELLGMFEEWKPASKVLKDVRWRLEAVQSKL